MSRAGTAHDPYHSGFLTYGSGASAQNNQPSRVPVPPVDSDSTDSDDDIEDIRLSQLRDVWDREPYTYNGSHRDGISPQLNGGTITMQNPRTQTSTASTPEPSFQAHKQRLLEQYGEIFKKWPPIIVDLCAIECAWANKGDPYAVAHFLKNMIKVHKNEKSQLWDLTYHAMHLCKDANLSVQSAAYITNACVAIAQKMPKDSAYFLSYNTERERKNKIEFIQRMPQKMHYALMNLCIENDYWVNSYWVNSLIAVAYLLGHPQLKREWEEKDVYSIAAAYSLQDIENDYRKDIYFSMKGIFRDSKAEELTEAHMLTEQFIATFKYKEPVAVQSTQQNIPLKLVEPETSRTITDIIPVITRCHTHQVDAIRKDSVAQRLLRKTLAETYDRLLGTTDAAELCRLKNPEQVAEAFRENLPKCPLCLELFLNHFADTCGGVELRFLCAHAVCALCVQASKPPLKVCPLCRKANWG